MISRRTAMAGIGGSLAAAPLLRARAQGPRRRIRLHALVVGINTYTGQVGERDQRTGRMISRPIRKLAGCINDAEAIVAAVRPIAASLHVLTETAVTRPSVLQAWREIIAAAAAGDTVLFTYSGHGGLERARPGDDRTHHPTLLLSGFDAGQPPSRADRIASHEIRSGLIEAASARGVRIVFVADCCHAGTLTRSVDARIESTVVYRTVQEYDLADELKPVAPKTSQRPEAPNVLYFSASQDHEVTPEIKIDGRPHGAMSVAFARALSGLASTSPDGAVTGGQLRDYVMGQVRSLSDSAQHPNVIWPTPDARGGILPTDILIYTPKGLPPAATSASPTRLRILNLRAAKVVSALSGAELVTADADLTWDAGARDVLNREGQKIAEGIEAGALQPVIERVQALESLKRLAATGGLDLRLLLPGEAGDAPASVASDRVHAEGTRLTLQIGGLRLPHLVVFNLTGSGLVQLLYPNRKLSRGGEGIGDPATVPTGRPYLMPPVKVQPPFGSDHVIVVASARPADELIAEFERLDGSSKPALAMAAIARFAAAVDVQVGFQGIFTRGK